MVRMGSSGDGWGHIGATSGPRSTGSQRTTPVTIGHTTAQLTEQTRPSAAGHRDRPAVPDTEAHTGSAAPPGVQLGVRPPLAMTPRQRALPASTQGSFVTPTTVWGLTTWHKP